MDDQNHPRPRLLLRVQEAAALLGLSRSRTYELLRDGQLSAVKIGNATRIPATEVERLVREAPPARFRPLPMATAPRRASR